MRQKEGKKVTLNKVKYLQEKKKTVCTEKKSTLYFFSLNLIPQRHFTDI